MKAMKKKQAPNPEVVQPASMIVQVTVDDDNSSEPVYANYAEIVRSQHEIEVRFTRIPAKPSQDQIETLRAGAPLSLYPLCKVVMPLQVAKGLSEAIIVQLQADLEVPK